MKNKVSSQPKLKCGGVRCNKKTCGHTYKHQKTANGLLEDLATETLVVLKEAILNPPERITVGSFYEPKSG